MKWFLPVFFVFCVSPTVAHGAEEKAALQQAKELYFSGQQEEALAAYIDLSKKNQDKISFLNAAFIALERNQAKKAVDIMMAAYRIYPQDENILDMLAEALLSDGQYTAAERILSLFPSQKPEKAAFHYINLARAQRGLNERKLAKFNLEMATRSGTHAGLAYYLLGTLQNEDKQYSQARESFAKAVAHDPQFTEARRSYAQALEKTGKKDEAIRQYRMIYTVDKHDDITNKALARLKVNVSAHPTPTSTEKKPLVPSFVTPISIPPLYKPEEVKIGLGVQKNGHPSARTVVQFTMSHPFTITNSHGIALAKGNAGEEWQIHLQQRKPFILTAKGTKIPFKKIITVTPRSNDNTKAPTFILKNIMSGAGMTWMSVTDREYRGKLQVVYNPNLNTLVPINIVTIEEYLLGVIASEMPTQFPADALKAQAVLARTYALKHKNKHKKYGFDLCDSQNCQVYGGVLSESPSGNDAVSTTLGEVLLYEDKPIEGVFSANTGGITQSAQDAGWSETPYLHSVSDYKRLDLENLQPYQFKELLQYPQEAYSRYDKNVSASAFRWARVITIEDLQKEIQRKKKDIGKIVALIPEQRTKSGYVSKLIVKGTKGQITLKKENIIRSNLGLGMLRSSYFIVEPNYENRQLKYFVLYGGGWGHGVGFDQTGAAGRAEEGQHYQTILHHYFPLANFYSPLEQISPSNEFKNSTFLDGF